MASNHQLLSNEYAGTLEKKSSPRPSLHTIEEYFGLDERITQTPAWPMMAALAILLVCLAFGDRMMNFVMACIPSFRFGDLDIEEEIDSYWNVLNEADRAWSLKEEENIRHVLGSQVLTNQQYASL